MRFVGSTFLIIVMLISLYEESGAIQPVYSGRTVNEMASEIGSGKPVATPPEILEVVAPGNRAPTDSNNTHKYRTRPDKEPIAGNNQGK